MIGLSVVTGVIGVAQTWISNDVGQRVMHDLRAAVYAHLQRMSLAFFTRTRTGEVQSRIANDIGGVDNVVTSPRRRSSRTSPPVAATVVAMFLLDWRLAVVLAVPDPVLHLADAPRRRGAQAHHGRDARAGSPTSRRWSRSRSRSPGSCSARRWAAARELVRALPRRVGRARRPRGPLAGWPGAGGWRPSR